jgi:hypothetical protein
MEYTDKKVIELEQELNDLVLTLFGNGVIDMKQVCRITNVDYNKVMKSVKEKRI